jgi:hypothetical protein
MSNDRLNFNRRRLLQGSALGAVAAATGVLGAPAVLRAQGAAVKLGVLHPVSGALSYWRCWVTPSRPRTAAMPRSRR